MRVTTTTFAMVLTRAMAAASALAMAACGGGAAKVTTVGNTGGGGGGRAIEASLPGFVDGALWSCQIGDYDPQPCRLSQRGGGWQLTKLMGSQRFDGAVSRRGVTLAFDGDYFCPWGDCTTPMVVEFTPDGPDAAYGPAAYVTTFGDDEIRLRWDADLDNEYGGAGYGKLTGREQ